MLTAFLTLKIITHSSDISIRRINQATGNQEGNGLIFWSVFDSLHSGRKDYLDLCLTWSNSHPCICKGSGELKGRNSTQQHWPLPMQFLLECSLFTFSCYGKIINTKFSSELNSHSIHSADFRECTAIARVSWHFLLAVYCKKHQEFDVGLETWLSIHHP